MGLPGDGPLPLEGEVAKRNQLPGAGDKGLFPVLVQLLAEAGLGHSIELVQHVNDGRSTN